MNADLSLVKGIIPPILTPIDENELINEAKLRKQVDFVINGGVHGILAFGSNGEFYMLEESQMEKGIRIILDAAKGRVPVYFGIGAIKTSKCVNLAKMAAGSGAFGISVLAPMFLSPTDTELYRHFKTIADAVPDMPMLMYNNPGRLGYCMSENLVKRLAEDVENIIGIKDSSGDMTLTGEYIRLTRHLDFKVLGGKDTLIYATLAHGGAGAVATVANIFPELVSSVYESYAKGDLSESLEHQYRLNPVRISMDKASFPVATKDMANLMGLDAGAPFAPSINSQGEVLEFMADAMRKAELL